MKKPNLEITFEITGLETIKPQVQIRIAPLTGRVLIRKNKEMLKLILRDFTKELETI